MKHSIFFALASFFYIDRLKVSLLSSIFLLLSPYGIGQTTNDESDRLLAIQDSIFRSLTGKVFPLDSLNIIDGKKLISNDLIGKPTLINFWFTTCKPCIDEMPVLNEIKRSYINRINFIAVTYEDKAKVNNFLHKYKFDFTQVVNAQKYIDNIGFISFPVNIILDKNRIVVSIQNGIPYISNEKGELKIGEGHELRDILEKLL